MKSNLDVWAIQYFPNELYTALNQIKGGTNIIYSNCTCNFKIGNEEISTRQFDTFLYNEESDILIMLMRGGKATKEDMIKYLEENNHEYYEVTFIPMEDKYEDGNDISELWFARERYVLEDALDDSIDKGVQSCEYYPLLNGSLELGYISNSNDSFDIEGRLFQGLIKTDDKIVLIINQKDNIDVNGKDRNLNYKEILEVINSKGFNCTVITDSEPELRNKTNQK